MLKLNQNFGESACHKTPTTNTESNMIHAVSRNDKNHQITNEDVSDAHSVAGSDTTNHDEIHHRCRINTIIRRTQSHAFQKDLDYTKSPTSANEKGIMKALNTFFEPLLIRISSKDEEAVDFRQLVESYVQESSGTTDVTAIRSSDNLLWKCLSLTEQLSVISSEVNCSNSEKLKLYISVLGSQVNLNSQKYCESRGKSMKDAVEISYLKSHKKGSLETKGRWCQIDTFYTQSTISLKIHTLKNAYQNKKAPNFGWRCIIKGDDTTFGQINIPLDNIKSSDAININLPKDIPFEIIAIEIYEDFPSSAMMGKCYISVMEILDMSLFNPKVTTNLPIMPHDDIEDGLRPSHLKNELASSTGALKHDGLEQMSDHEFYSQLQFALMNGGIGVVRVEFEVCLTTDFADTIEELRNQRLENLEVFAEENATQLKEQLDFLKFSLSPIHTLDFDPRRGVFAKNDPSREGKKDKRMCGMGKMDKICNIF